MKDTQYEEYAKLFREDPAEFKKRTRQLIEDYINCHPEEKRPMLRELETIIDVEVDLCDDPDDAFRMIFRMMTDICSKKGT